MVLHSPNLAECVELPVFAGCTDEKYQDRPTRRSGHRSFVDGDFLYVVGGRAMINADDDEPSILREVWRYNLWTHVWDDVPVDENFPTALLSFSLAITNYGSPQAIIFGGTDFPIGETSSNNEVHVVTVLDDSVHTMKLRVVGNKAATYGQAMCQSSTDPDTFFVVGGTKGREFSQDVHSLKKDASEQWYWRKLNPFMPTLDGLYRMEVVQHRRRLLLFFGGGTRTFVRRFEKLTVFDLDTTSYKEVDTMPCLQTEGGWPHPRSCHSLVRWRHQLVMCGGCCNDTNTRNPDADPDRPLRHLTNQVIFSDIWFLDLNTMKWSKSKHSLHTSVSFHDAAVTKEGQVVLFGGDGTLVSRERTTNVVQSFWIAPPTLKLLAAHVVSNTFPQYFRAHPQVKLSSTIEVVTQLTALLKDSQDEPESSITAQPQ